MPRWLRLRLGMRVMSRPNSATEPLSGASSPVMRLNRVVLPAPFGPMISRRSPGATLRLTLVVTRKPPNDLHRLPTASAGAVMASAPWRTPPSCRPCSSAGSPQPRRARQPHGARHQPFRHEDDDGDEDGAEHEIPARDVGAHHVLDDDDQRRADDRPEQRSGAAGDHHQQTFRRGGERQRLRADELGVVDEQDAGDGGQQAGEHEGPEADHPDVIAERVHAARLVARAAQRGAERRAHEDRHRGDRKQKDDQRRVIEGARRIERQAERRRPASTR